jgi:hypothetical protein
LLDQLLADTGSGHNITHSVFVECGSMYRAGGPTELKPVGETEFVNGTSAMSASGHYGKGRLCAGIVGHADMRLGDGVARVLEAQIAAGDGRFRGIQAQHHSAFQQNAVVGVAFRALQLMECRRRASSRGLTGEKLSRGAGHKTRARPHRTASRRRRPTAAHLGDLGRRCSAC